MEARKRNYDAVAGCYDWLSRLVFGKSLIRAQTDLFHFLQDGDKILIAGGGTGELLEAIDRTGVKDVTVVYVETSVKMLDMARKRKLSNLRVEFIHAAVEDTEISYPFKVIITPFLFDNFDTTNAKNLLLQLSAHLQQEGFWLFTDFHIHTQSPIWQKLLLRIMYTFFHKTAGIQSRALPDMEKLFREQGFRKRFETRRYCGFIQSVVWQKQGL